MLPEEQTDQELAVEEGEKRRQSRSNRQLATGAAGAVFSNVPSTRSFSPGVNVYQVPTTGVKPMRITVQSFRKADASWLANENHPDVVIQANLGHAPGSSVTRNVRNGPRREETLR